MTRPKVAFRTRKARASGWVTRRGRADRRWRVVCIVGCGGIGRYGGVGSQLLGSRHRERRLLMVVYRAIHIGGRRRRGVQGKRVGMGGSGHHELRRAVTAAAEPIAGGFVCAQKGAEGRGGESLGA